MSREKRDPVAFEGTIETTIRMERSAAAPWIARQHVRGRLPAHLTAGCTHDLVLLTSELVANAVEHSQRGPIHMTVRRRAAFTRIEVSNPSDSWVCAPEERPHALDRPSGRGLLLVEQLSDRWGSRDDDCAVWFEVEHRGAASADLRSGEDRRRVSMSLGRDHERRRPACRRGRPEDGF